MFRGGALLRGQAHGFADGQRDGAGLLLKVCPGRGEAYGDGAFVLGTSFASNQAAGLKALEERRKGAGFQLERRAQLSYGDRALLLER
ncbi:hypothetical protein EES47_26205 [Streptomyces sp. ADI98-12]|nr:hypothetical protein EES47_26205 [Streptomyces sp. ADI98-12]